MSLISRLKAVVAGDEYLDDDFDELDYPSEDELNDINNFKQNPKNANALANSNPFDFMNNNRSSKVVGMPGISNSSSEVSLMEPRSFDEMPQAIQALRERKKYWLLPIIIVLALFGVLIVLSQGSAVAPFIYTIF